MRVRVELPETLDISEHAAAHDRDEIPDRTPYGLHHLTDAGDVDLVFRRPRTGPLAWVSRRVRNRLDGYEAVAAGLDVFSRSRRTADVVLCMDERTGFPAALAPGGPPVVSNLIWVGRPEEYARPARRVVGRALRSLDGLVSMSDSLADDLTAGWDLEPARVQRVRVGIDTDFFAPRPWSEVETAAPVVASVGDDFFRDHPLLVEAVRRLRARGTAARLELGTTRREVEVPDELGVVHRRRMEGAVRAMYGRSGVVALALRPTMRGSGSTVVLEAAASARPVVATRTPAMERLIEHGERGLLVDPEDPDALAAAIGELLGDPARARTMGEAARAWVLREHTSTVMAGDLRQALDVTVGRGR